MQPARLSVALLPTTLIAFCIPGVQEDAYARPPWGDPGDKPDRGNRNKAPTIAGTPPTTAEVDRYYAFQPQASDRDGDTLRFSITSKPAWAAFDTSSGFLSGYPAAEDAGAVTQNIVISVSDGNKSASLAPFSITVAGDANSPPVIGGTPPGEVLVNESYRFLPSASDPDQDVLHFSGANLPAWAALDPSSGRLSGTPGEAHVGVYEDIRITVSDGTVSDALDPFAITVVQVAAGSVSLSWVAPTRNTDGTPLTDLAGYRIYYGTASGDYGHQVAVGAGVTSAVIDDLTPGSWYFAAAAFNTSGAESDLSGETQHVVD